ncbi:MAG: phytanoyl-CoA dioxygenase family protein [Phycisphaerae bacterium]
MSKLNPSRRIDAPYELTAQNARRFREDGFVKLRNVFDAATLEYYGAEITRLTLEANPHKDKLLEERDTYHRAFIQVANLWRRSKRARELSFSGRLARLATELLGTVGVRMYHDQALCKEPGGGLTPWHVDQQYWPMATGQCVTAWIPLHAIPLEMGPLCFAPGSHLKNIGRDLAVSDESERIIREGIKRHGVIEVCEPYVLGEVSFHLGWTLHRAGPNTTDRLRKVHTVIYMDEDMRLQPRNQNQRIDWAAFSPSTRVGEIMDDPLNPVLFTTRE